MEKELMKNNLFSTQRRLLLAFTVFFFGIPLFLALNIHSRCGIFNYHAEVFGDKAGYFVFLPSSFIYGFDASAFPDSVEYKTGFGFILNRQTGEVFSKYPVGTAVLQSPFFLTAHFLAPLFGYEQNGFSLPYHKAVDIAAVFYLFIGIYFLQKYLRYYFPDKIFVNVMLAFFTYGTNLIYYTTQETGMSHVYSFCLFSILIYYWKRIGVEEKVKMKHIILLSVAAGLIILTRQINVLFLPFVFLIDVKGMKGIQERFLKLYKYIPLMGGIVVICFLPQTLYYLYLAGKIYMDLYINESFIYKFSPKILEVLFSFQNGFFPYSPLHLFTIIGILWMVYTRKTNGITLLVLFLFVTYLNASWHSWMLGCAFGNRGFIDFYPLFSLGFFYIVHEIFYGQHRKGIKICAAVLIMFFTYYNFTMGFNYTECWFGETEWDSKEYLRLLSRGLTI